MPDIDWGRVRDWLLTHGLLRRRLIRAFLEENVRVPFPPHVVVASTYRGEMTTGP
jgi:hypothetical protein